MSDETLSLILQKYEQLHQRVQKLESHLLAANTRLEHIQIKLQNSEKNNANMLKDVRDIQSFMSQFMMVFPSNTGLKH